MKRTHKLILAGLLTAGLMTPSFGAIAIAKQEHGSHGQHKGWDKGHGKKFDHSTHDRRDFHRGGGYEHNKKFDRSTHDRRDFHRGRYDHDRRTVRYDRRHDGRIDNRGHHNKAEIRQDFRDVRAARKEVHEGKTELRKDYAELRKDRAELRRDIRSGASKEEIMKGRQEIRGDLREIRNDRIDLRKDQARLDAARQELKSDLRRR
jgi:hypothetical protein